MSVSARQKHAQAMWCGRPLATLGDAELVDALAFVQQVIEAVAGHSPPEVWAYFAALRSDLTIEQARRLPGMKNPAL